MVTFLSAWQFSASFLPSFLVVLQFPLSLLFPFFLVVQQFFLAAFPIFLFSVPLTFEDMPPRWYKTFCNSEFSITRHPQLLKSFLLPLATQWLSFPNTVSCISHDVSFVHNQPELCDHSSTLYTTGMPWASLQWLPKSLAAKAGLKSRAADLASQVSLPTTQGPPPLKYHPPWVLLLNSGALS